MSLLLQKDKTLALSFTIVQYAATVRVRNSPIPHFLFDIVNNYNNNNNLYTSVSSVSATILHTFPQRYVTEFSKNVAFSMTYSSF